LQKLDKYYPDQKDHFLLYPPQRCLYYNEDKILTLYKNLLHKAAVVFIVCVLAILIALSASLFSQNIEAHDNDILHKYYTSVTIHPGDSLWSIANEHYQLGYDNQNEYINEVMQINHITDADDLISGTSIVIPYYSEEIK